MAAPRSFPALLGFASRFPVHRTDSRSYELRSQGSYLERDYFVPDAADVESLCYRAAFAVILSTKDVYQFITTVANTISLVSPSVELEEKILEALDNAGVRVNKIEYTRVRRAFAEKGLPLPEFHKKKANVQWACMIIAMFKNFTADNFDSDLDRRILALKRQALLPISTIVLQPYNLEMAQNIRTMLGSQRELCGAVIRMLVGIGNMSSEASFQNVCLYLIRMISWSEMNAFELIYESLIVTNSKVLREASIRAEVQKLANTVAEIIKFEMPQFFRYLAPAKDTLLLDRSRFPLLITIAQRIKFGTENTTTNNFVTHKYSDDMIKRYLEIHRQGLEEAAQIGRC